MNHTSLQTHTLFIYNQPEPHQIFLTATTYSMGRDPLNGIVIPHKNISRQHALLLRMPLLKKGQYGYRILDGNSTGQASLNGLIINGVKRATWDLNSGDSIILGGAIALTYQVIDLPTNSKYLNYIKLNTPTQTELNLRVRGFQSTLASDGTLHDNYPYWEEQLASIQALSNVALFSELFP